VRALPSRSNPPGRCRRQVAQITAAIEKARASNLVAVLVSPVRDDNLRPTARAAAEAAWSGLYSTVRRISSRSCAGSSPVGPSSCEPEQAEIGRIHGQQVRALMPDGGCVLCMTGPLAASSAQHSWTA